jgi:hypothetical protein
MRPEKRKPRRRNRGVRRSKMKEKGKPEMERERRKRLNKLLREKRNRYLLIAYFQLKK